MTQRFLLLCAFSAACQTATPIDQATPWTPQNRGPNQPTAPAKTDDPVSVPTPTPLPDPTPGMDPIPDPEPTPALPFVNTGWVGGACESDAQCTIGGSTCRTNFPGGMCSLDCDGKFCADTDAPNTTTTFCAAATNPTCVSRCSFADTEEGRGYPETGCREGYVCATRPRHTDSSAVADVCVPEAPGIQPISACRMAYARAGNVYQAWNAPNASTTNGTCTVTDPMSMVPLILDVPLMYAGTDAATLRGRCELATALQRMVAIAKDMGVKEVEHLGVYNCREIAGTTKLSQHAYGRAIDLSGFIMENGERITVLSHWERGDATPETTQGRFLYDFVHRLHEEHVFNIILTPEYNAAHHDHFHVDLTPGSDFISGRASDEPYLGEFDGVE